ncbi:hypothetical protein BDF22DRAFT_695737 [Syncephalis plumigaleata]|nr:hypothetical protein BDF22DRAFT_695737 [Syncephalis plumigaleata]
MVCIRHILLLSIAMTFYTSSDPKLSCQLLNLLSVLPLHDQNRFLTLLGYAGLVRLSASCRFLWCNVRESNTLWKALYKHDYLSSIYSDKEWEFALWCARTSLDGDTTGVPVRRMDLLKHPDCLISCDRPKRMPIVPNSVSGTGLILKSYSKFNNRNYAFHYSVECPAHTNLTEPTEHATTALDDDQVVTIFSRNCKDVISTIRISRSYRISQIYGKWALLVKMPDSLSSPNYPFCVYITVYDVDQDIQYSAGIDTIWHLACIYEASDRDVTVYTARLDDEGTCIEWALYQFCSPTFVKQVRTGSICLPKMQQPSLVKIVFLHESRVMLKLSDPSLMPSLIIYSIASSGRSEAPKYSFHTLSSAVPIPLLAYHFRFTVITPITLYCEHPITDDQILRIPRAFRYDHVIGNLYLAATQSNSKTYYQLVDINKKEVVRTLDISDSAVRWIKCTAISLIVQGIYGEKQIMIFNDYGAL